MCNYDMSAYDDGGYQSREIIHDCTELSNN
jgi:hypothetical protein